MAIDPDKPHAFLSYTRADDDDYFKGGISWLREELEKLVRGHTGYPFQIFQDVEDIQPGDRWANKLDQALESAQLFIPILTPSFFRSDFCRREARAFLDYEAKAKRAGLILPLYLIRAPVLESAKLREADDLATALRERQHDDWRSVAVRLQHEGTRWEVMEKIVRLAEAIAEVVEHDIPDNIVPDVIEDIVDTPPEPAPPGPTTDDASTSELSRQLEETKARLAETASRRSRRPSPRLIGSLGRRPRSIGTSQRRKSAWKQRLRRVRLLLPTLRIWRKRTNVCATLSLPMSTSGTCDQRLECRCVIHRWRRW